MAASTTASVQMTLDPEIAALLPRPGEWTEDDYLWLIRSTNRLVELVDGQIEVLPMPTFVHQAVLRFLFSMLFIEMQRVNGEVICAPLSLRIASNRFREPDILCLLAADDQRMGNEYWEGADFVIEIVSPTSHERDYVEKPVDYALAGITEYWIVDPQTWMITTLLLEDGSYVEQGVYGRGATATSVLLPNFVVEVDQVFAVATRFGE